MERFTIDAAAAFGFLKRLSQESNTPLAEIARRLATTEDPHRRTQSVEDASSAIELA